MQVARAQFVPVLRDRDCPARRSAVQGAWGPLKAPRV